MAAILMISGLLTIKVFWNKDYDVIIYVIELTNKILSRNSNYIVDAVMWSKFGKFSIFTKDVIIISILQELNQKKHLFWGMVLVQVQ